VSLSLVLLVLLIALVFEYINGFHDTANSIATVVATKVLRPGQAVLLAAFTNLLGAMWGTAVAKTIASGLVDTSIVAVTPQVIICALLGGTMWNLLTWWVGLPSSSSHALIGGLCGASLAAADNRWSAIIWSQPATPWYTGKGLLWKVIAPMVTSPLIGFVMGFLLMGTLLAVLSFMNGAGGWLARVSRPRSVNATFGRLQILSASAMGIAHGTNDAQKTMGIIALAMVGAHASGALDQLPWVLSFLRPSDAALHSGAIDLWIKVVCAVVMAAGTAAGGWRIIRTLGHKTVKLHPINGFAAELTGATVLTVTSTLGIPVSTTHNISAAIMGVGTAKRLNAVKWTVVERMVWAWILTIPVAGGLAYVLVRAVKMMGWGG
jgi:inorganic phosphate transporter, PiT family